MPNPATTDDIRSRWRSLTSSETTVAETRLDDAWRKLKRDVPDLETRMASDDDLLDDAIRVLADSVIRVLQSLARNGVRRGSVGVDDGQTSWELDPSVQAGLYFTDEELSDLSATGKRKRARAFSVQPT